MTTTVTQLAEELTDAIFDANPIEATALGIRDREDRLPDYREAAEEAWRLRVTGIRARAGDAVAAGNRNT